ncbi:uncharacterized protein LOC112083433 [Eutrema salsugineum]|uniref:uncharacterized protein LOC112083433 n=1 Tax=Eutrema salsugineum TaxID=72664 RepID=UPI000CED71A9|nr:uncharacterized protein LOC112083433 [Eutrema salsugineum]
MKVIEKKMWYIGECMFLVAQWDASGGTNLDIDAIPIWAHLKGMPFDLMHHKGISLVASLVGEPKEMDEFTRNMVSLSEAHVKVEQNLNTPLPSSAEVVRESGEVLTVAVEYPWILPICSHCKEIGHVIRYCPGLTLSWFQAKMSSVESKQKGK